MASGGVPFFRLLGVISIDNKDAKGKMKDFEKETKKTADDTDKSFDKMKGAAKALGAVLATTFAVKRIADWTMSLINSASDAEEMQNKFDVVFDGINESVEEWAETYANAVGRSVLQTKEFLAGNADLLIGLGFTKDEAFELSKQIVELGTDLASFNNLQDPEAIDALTKAMLGEAEAAKSLGLLLNVERVKDFAEAQGFVFEELTDVERATLTYELALTQSTNALGDAERSSGSYANQQKALQATIEDTKAELGEGLLPVATSFVTLLRESVVPAIAILAEQWLPKLIAVLDVAAQAVASLSNFYLENQIAMNNLMMVLSSIIALFISIKVVTMAYNAVVAIGTTIIGAYTFAKGVLTGVILGVKAALIGETIAENASKVAKVANIIATNALAIAMGAWQVITWGVTAAQWLLNVALTANPIGLIIVAVVALIAGLALLIKWLLDAGVSVKVIIAIFLPFLAIPLLLIENWDLVVAFFKVAWASIVNTFQSGVDKIKKIIKPIQDFMDEVKEGVGGFFGDIGSGISDFFGGAFADGGRPPVGKPSLVGERGAELFVPSTSGRIIPNDQVRNALGEEPSGKRIIFEGDTIHINGDITKENLKRMIMTKRQNDRKRAFQFAGSGGGINGIS